MELSVLPVYECSVEQRNRVCQILNEKWPRPASTRMQWLEQSSSDLPTSFILFQNQTKVVGHARIVKSLRIGGHADTVSVILTSVIVDPHYRRQGFGRKLLKLMEKECLLRNFGRIVLWTDDQVEFYEACGYIKCRPLKMIAEVTSKMQKQQLLNLESMIRGKAKKLESDTISASAEKAEILELSEEEVEGSDDGYSSVWLSKRLLENFDHFYMKRDQVELDIREQLYRQDVDLSNAICHVCDVPNEIQIGPCCGLAALRCVQAYFQASTVYSSRLLQRLESGCYNIVEWSKPESVSTTCSMLVEAQKRGWTSDGEMFNTVRMARIGANPGGMNSFVIRDMDIFQICSLLREGVPVLVAFDKSAKDLEHCVSLDSAGRHAHWGIIRGMAFDSCDSSENIGITWFGEKNDAELPCSSERSLSSCTSAFAIMQHTKHDRISVVPMHTLIKSNKTVDACSRSDELGLGWIETDRMLANTWLVCIP